MNVIPLQSGSKGNCFYVETKTTRILIDTGITFRQARLRLQTHQRQIENVQHLFITHDHSDHCRYLADFARQLKLPVHLTEKTADALLIKDRRLEFTKSKVNYFSAGASTSIGDMVVHSIPTPHDAADGVAFVIENDDQRLGILTDLGHAFDGLKAVLESLQAVIIESNYDEEMLESGPYPWFLKNRIRGDGGHLSNTDSARLLSQHGRSDLRWACLCHLSDENNCPETAIRTHQLWLGEDYPLYVANRHTVSEILQI